MACAFLILVPIQLLFVSIFRAYRDELKEVPIEDGPAQTELEGGMRRINHVDGVNSHSNVMF